jgi:hypothetical protein
MGAWLVFNPYLDWAKLGPVVVNLCTLYSPIILVGAVLAALWLLKSRDWRLGPLPFAAAGLTVALLSIQHEWTVWVLRVFVTPQVLGVLSIVGLACALQPRSQRLVLGLAALATLVSLGATWHKVNNQKVPKAGKFRHEPGFHMMVRYADAEPVLTWLHEQEADWVIINHLNANLLRADSQCTLYNLGLRLGSPGMSLSERFEPHFGLPEGDGLVVFHAGAAGVGGCTLTRVFPESNMQVHRCGNPKAVKAVELEGE